MARARGVIGAAILLGFCTGAAAGGGDLYADVNGWRLIARESGPVNYYHVVADSPLPYIHGAYEPGYKTAVMGFEIPRGEERAFHHVTWKWRADILPRGGDECARGQEDSAAVVYVTWKPGTPVVCAQVRLERGRNERQRLRPEAEPLRRSGHDHPRDGRPNWRLESGDDRPRRSVPRAFRGRRDPGSSGPWPDDRRRSDAKRELCGLRRFRVIALRCSLGAGKAARGAASSVSFIVQCPRDPTAWRPTPRDAAPTASGRISRASLRSWHTGPPRTGGSCHRLCSSSMTPYTVARF